MQPAVCIVRSTAAGIFSKAEASNMWDHVLDAFTLDEFLPHNSYDNTE